jgi:hypothetical protein
MYGLCRMSATTDAIAARRGAVASLARHHIDFRGVEQRAPDVLLPVKVVDAELLWEVHPYEEPCLHITMTMIRRRSTTIPAQKCNTSKLAYAYETILLVLVPLWLLQLWAHGTREKVQKLKQQNKNTHGTFMKIDKTA